MKLHPLALIPLLSVALHAQNPPATPPDSHGTDAHGVDPFRNTGESTAPAAVEEEWTPLNLNLCYEVFSLPLAQAAKYQREQLADPELYERLIGQVDKNTAVQEAFSVLRMRSGEKGTNEAVIEHIYPVGYEPPELPNSVGLGVSPKTGKDAPDVIDPVQAAKAPPVTSIEGLRTPATATSFETRKVGLTVEAEATTDVRARYVDIRLGIEHIELVGRSTWGQEFSQTEMPEFESHEIHGGYTLGFNRPFLLGTVNRPPVSRLDPDSKNRVWFAFVTVTKASP